MLSLKSYQQMVFIVVVIVAFIMACATGTKQLSENRETAEIDKNPLNAKLIPYDTPPMPIGGFAAIQKNVIYPEAAEKAGIEGTVIIQAMVGENGDVVQSSVLKSSGNIKLDKAALTAITKTKFVPASNKGKPVGVYISVPVIFKIKGDSTKVDQSMNYPDASIEVSYW